MKWLFVAALGLALSACETTSVLSTWKKPGVGPISFKKVAVVAPNKNASFRRSVEDQVVAKLAPVIASVPSYTLLSEAESNDDSTLKAKVRDQGFDGAIVMRVVSVEKEATWVPGTSYGWGYGYGAWPAYGPGGYTEIDTYVRVETNIYSLPDEEMIFAATSRTANPANLRSSSMRR